MMDIRVPVTTLRDRGVVVDCQDRGVIILNVGQASRGGSVFVQKGDITIGGIRVGVERPTTTKKKSQVKDD